MNITTATITYFDAETGKTEKKSYNTDYVRYHLPFSANQYPDRLRKLVNNGQITAYLDDLEQ